MNSSNLLSLSEENARWMVRNMMRTNNLGYRYFNDFSTSIFKALPLTSLSLQSHSTQYSSLVEFALQKHDISTDEYLDDFLGGNRYEKSHDDVCKRLKAKLEEQFGRSCEISINAIVKYASQPLRPLFIKDAFCPDVSINIQDKSFLLFQVHSARESSQKFLESEYETNIKKLGGALVEQLRCLRQIDRDRTILSGFYLPTGHFPGNPIEKVTCEWDEKNLKFNVISKAYARLCHFQLDLVHIYEHQKEIFERVSQMHGVSSNIITLPLTADFLSSFGDGAFQISSGDSFVISTSETIFKRPFFEQERTRLLSFYLLRDFPVLQYSVLPVEIKLVNGIEFFKFNLCHYYPLPRETIRNLFLDDVRRLNWLYGVVRAILELHNHKIAHWDIRLPNICYNSNFDPVLIDLDRSVSSERVSMTLEVELQRFGRDSKMYDIVRKPGVPGTELMYDVDFRQLSIMLLYILDNQEHLDNEDDYNNTPTNLDMSHDFLKKLYNGDGFDEDLFKNFAEDSTIFRLTT